MAGRWSANGQFSRQLTNRGGSAELAMALPGIIGFFSEFMPHAIVMIVSRFLPLAVCITDFLVS